MNTKTEQAAGVRQRERNLQANTVSLRLLTFIMFDISKKRF